MSKVIRAISESLSKSIQMSDWAFISLDLSRERQKGLGGLVKEGIVNIEHRKEGNRRGDGEECVTG